MGRWSIEELAARMDEGVIQRLNHYVYRLIDPRNGETFYIGVGKGKRVLDHVRGVLDVDRTPDADGDDEVELKLNRISQIIKSGFEVAHIIHRHGIFEERLKNLRVLA